MKNWFTEVWIVFCLSTKTQLALGFGVAFFLGILLMGEMLVGGIELHGHLKPLTDVVRASLAHRYESAAWMALGSFLLLAIKTYRKERRRVFGY